MTTHRFIENTKLDSSRLEAEQARFELGIFYLKIKRFTDQAFLQLQNIIYFFEKSLKDLSITFNYS